MFTKLFNRFRKKQEEEQFTSVTYTMNDQNEVNVDISINSYDSESIQQLAVLLNTTHSAASLLTTIEMVKQNLRELEQEDLLLEFIVLITTLVNSSMPEDDNKKKPCVSPSDML